MTLATTTRTTCPYCGVGCGVLASTLEDGTVEVQGDPLHPANLGRLCSKGSALGETVGLDGRLLHPVVDGKQVSWDEALDSVSERLQAIIQKHGPDSVAFYLSGQLLTEDYYVANKLMKGFIGSGNIDTNSRLCMSSAVAAYKRALGSDTVPCSYEDLEIADLLVIAGSNAAWCHPVLFQRISKAKELRPDMKVVVIDPRRTATCDLADLHLPVKPGSDAYLFNGLLNYLKQHDKLDWRFIEQHVDGFADALQAAKTSSASIPAVATACELPESDVAEFFRLFAQTERSISFYSQGINQSSSGTDKCNAILNCHLATGRIGKPGMGPFSITGQPNAMGGREVGGLSNMLAAHMDIDNPSHRDLVSRFWKTDRLTTTPGRKAVDMFKDLGSGKIKAVWVLATNPVVSLPEADAVKKALEQCELLIVSDIEQQTDTTRHAHVLLPALAWGEKSGTVTNSERRISRQRAFLPAPGEARADWWMIAEVAKRMGFAEAFDFNSAADVFREHAALSGFENNNLRDFDISALATMSDSQFEQLKPVQWPVNEAAPKGTARLFTEHQFNTANGKAKMIAVDPRLPANHCDIEYPLVLNTGRIRDQWHTMTRTSRAPRLAAHMPEPVVEIHPMDAATWQLKDGALAELTSRWGRLIGRVNHSNSQRPGSVFVPIHWNSQFAALARVATLVNSVTDPLSGQPELKQTPVSIRAFNAEWHGFVLSRQPLDLGDTAYWVKVRGEQFWRYELAGESALPEASEWVRVLLGPEGDWLDFSDQKAGRYRAAKFSGDSLQAVAFIARDFQLPQRQWLSELFSRETLNQAERMSLLSGRPASGLPDQGKMICACFGVGEKTIEQGICERRLTSVDQIGDALKAGTNCGSCIPELQQMLRRLQ